MYYIEPSEALQELAVFGYEADLAKVELILKKIQAEIEAWLNFSPLEQEYTEKKFTDYRGLVYLSQWPISEILGIRIFLDSVNFYDLTHSSIQFAWNKENSILIESYPQFLVEIKYIAGEKKVSKDLQMATMDCLMEVAENNWNYRILSEPVRDTTSVSISGVSKNVRLGKGAEGKEPGTILDRILSSKLARYRRTTIY